MWEFLRIQVQVDLHNCRRERRTSLVIEKEKTALEGSRALRIGYAKTLRTVEIQM